MTVSKKVGGAVVRNRVKRWVREYLRRHLDDLPAGDTVLIARASAAQAGHVALDQDLASLLSKLQQVSR